jgi:NAD(P)-dependent dehydrogenase (short-subunit alcohol dehydrogenase family)
MNGRLQNKRALVTGGSRGMGAAIVSRLAHEGADVVLTYLNRPGEAGHTAASVRETGVRVLAIQADSTMPETFAAALEKRDRAHRYLIARLERQNDRWNDLRRTNAGICGDTFRYRNYRHRRS